MGSKQGPRPQTSLAAPTRPRPAAGLYGEVAATPVQRLSQQPAREAAAVA